MKMLKNMFNIRKASIREVVHRFAKLNQSLRPGQTIEITAHGKAFGRYTKAPVRRIVLPNFYADARKDGARAPKVGDVLLKRLLADDEAVS
jgi:hypothetical protein